MKGLMLRLGLISIAPFTISGSRFTISIAAFTIDYSQFSTRTLLFLPSHCIFNTAQQMLQV